MTRRARSLVVCLGAAVSSVALAGCGGDTGGYVSTPRPGLGLIAFEKDDGIYVANPDGSGTRRLTRAQGSVVPRWAPSGRELAFLAKRDGQWDVYVVRPDGSGERRLTRTRAEEMTVEWAPDGLSLALVVKGRSEYTLEVVGRIGGTPRVVASGVAGDDLPEWSPDSRRLAVVRRGTITIVDLEGVAARELVRGTTPCWSPDGQRIAFTRGSQTYVVGVDGSGERRLGSEGSINVVPKFSPDGESVAFETIGGALDILSGKVGIGVASVDGSGMKTVVSDAADYPPVWSPDGSSLLYIRGVDEHGFVNYDVCAVRLADGKVTVIAGSDEPEYVGPAAWQRLPAEVLA
jgi:Tol biopolymer transport system component